MSHELAEKMRRARESIIEIDGHKFTIRRPTEGERMELLQKANSPLAMVRACVVDWDLKEIDLIPDGMPDPAIFSAEVFAEYVNDRPLIWQPLHAELVAQIDAYHEKVYGAKKN